MSGGLRGNTRHGRGGPWRWALGLLMIVTLAGGWFTATPAALAASIVVTSAADDGSGGCTLREAIEAANTDAAVGDCAAGSGVDTITFGPGVTGPIALSGTDLLITSSLTIQGPGQAALTISGNGTSRVFRVVKNQEPSGDISVTIAGLTIQNGRDGGTQTAGGQGGGIYADRVRLTLQGVTLKDNTAAGSSANACCSSAGGQGGGIYAQDSNLALSGVTVGPNNLADGGILTDDCCAYAGGLGGGIHVQGGQLRLQGSTVNGNSANGGIWSAGFQNYGAAGQGGGIYAHGALVALEGSTIGDNTATGGIVQFMFRDAGAQGGGLFADNSDVSASETIISGNKALGGYSYSHVNGGDGGGAYVRDGSLTVIGGRIADNLADGSNVVPENGAGDGGAGGGLYVATGKLTLTGVAIAGNTAAAAHAPSISGAGVGGGLYMAFYECTDGEIGRRGNLLAVPSIPLGTPTITATTFAGNTAAGLEMSSDEYYTDGGKGGGAFVASSCYPVTLAIVSSTFDGNTALASGGAAGVGGQGGGLQIDGGNADLTVLVAGSTFINNSVTVGASGTSPEGVGGGINVVAPSLLEVYNSTFNANTAGRSGAAIFATAAAVARATNVTVVGNVAPAGGGQLAAEVVGTLAVTNSIVAAGGAAGNCAGPVVNGGHNLDDADSCGFGPGGRANTAPQLGPLADNGGPTLTYHPLPTSPALDAADNLACPAADQRGVARPQGATCDIGAVEYPRVAPTLTLLDPATAPQGSAAVPLTVTGTDFVAGLSAIRFGDTTLPTTFVSPTQLTATVPAALLTTVGTVGVTVTTSGPGGGTSNSLPFQVTTSATYTVTVTVVGNGQVSPGTGPYPGGAVPAFAATHPDGQVFVGWTLDGVYVGYAPTLDFTVTRDRTLVATFVPRPAFGDVPATDADWQAITFLAALRIVNPNGVNGSGNFEPDREVIRAETASFIARLFGWNAEFHRNNFPDRCDALGQNCVDDELWNNVAALADYGVVGGYTDGPTCDSAGTTTPCYLPRDPVIRLQVVSIVARAFIKTPDLRPTGFWDRLAYDPAQYTNVPTSGSQRSDLTTYRANAGPIPGQASDATFPTPFAASDRRFVVAVLYQAFNAWYSVDRVP